MSDRTVHAEHPVGEQVVRYERSGKWWIELVAPSPPWRGQTAIGYAVQRAIELRDEGGVIHFGLPGGTRFDALVLAAGASR